MRRIAVVNPVGFEGGGATTLCAQYAKLGIDCWFKSNSAFHRSDFMSESSIKLYSCTKELLELAKQYDRLLFVNMWFGKTMPENVLDDVVLLRKTFPKLEICYVHCSRRLLDLYALLPVCQKYNFMFDYIFSLNPMIKTFGYCNSIAMNINAFTIPEYNPVKVEDRNRVVFTAGRLEAYKGFLRFFNSIDDTMLQNMGDFVYIHEGAKYNHHKKDDGISCPPQMLSIFDTTVSPKVLKPQFVLREYGDEPLLHKFNIYPSYDMKYIYDRWRYYYVGVCCILGSRSAYVCSNSLFGDSWIINDSREYHDLEKRASLWSDVLEYADIEKIVFGIPVLFSRKYSQIIGFTDDRLIYNSYGEIPKKVYALQEYYDDARENQYQWFVDKMKNVNDIILEQFTKDLK